MCIYCVVRLDMGVAGLGIATCIAYFSMFFFTAIYAYCIETVRKAMHCPTKDSFCGWKDYLAISGPATIMLLAEGWAFNILGVLAGLISVTDQATNTILLMMIAVLFMVPMGIQSAACAIIGEQIGAGRVAVAKEYFRVMSLITLIMLAFVQLIFCAGRDKIINAFTTDPAVAELAESCFIIIVFAFIPDMI